MPARTADWSQAPAMPVPSNPKFKDLRGKKFGRLEPIELLATNGANSPTPCSRTMWRCRCECNSLTAVRASHLTGGKQVSCGCHQAEIRGDAQRTHGESHYPNGEDKQTVEYTAWMMMRARCNNPNDKRFDRYGGRGIQVCDRWENGEDGLGGYECFLADMGRKPSPKHSIDRYPDNDGNYEPGNCRWANYNQQARNRSDTVRVSYNGEVMALADACEKIGARYPLVRDRMHRGWSFERAASEPAHWRGR